jgi:hypothetical protein
MRNVALTVLLVCISAPFAHADSLHVVKMAFGTGIENHTITGVDTSFSAEVGRLYFWSVTAGPMTPDTIYHTWYRNGREYQQTAIEVRGTFYRAHTFKTITPKLAGTWKVTVSDAAGNVLAADSATVRAAAKPEE